MLGIATKSPPETTLKGGVIGVRELAKVLGGFVAGGNVRLLGWRMRLLLPVPPMPTFEKAVKPYDVFVNYTVAATVEINTTFAHLLTHSDGRRFVRGHKTAWPKDGGKEKRV